jgi:tetratricopeptide (TPR) repeat protein
VWKRLLNSVVGFDRIKHRGDRYFLDGDFHHAKREYERARSTLAPVDYRVATIDALIRECSARTGEPTEVMREGPNMGAAPTTEEDRPFVPDMNDLLELAIAGKTPERAALYRGLRAEFAAGYVALVQGEPARAIELLQLAGRKLRPTFVLHLELARALSMAGDMKAARAELENALRLSPEDLEGSNLMGAVLIQLSKYQEAEKVLLPLIDRREAEVESVFLLGQSLAGQGRRGEALARFREAVERDSDFHDAYFEGGRLLKEDGDDAGALRLLKRACSILPDEVDYNRELATLVLEKELDVAVGLAACDRLMITDEENRWEYLSWIAELYLRNGWRREAIDPLRKAIALVPSDLRKERLGLQTRLADIERIPNGA